MKRVWNHQCNRMAPCNIAHPVRYVLAVAGLLALVGALAGVKAAQISSLVNMGKQAGKAGPPPETVATLVAEKQTWEGSLSAGGGITSAEGRAPRNHAARA